jgi:hypothetical protein
VPALPHRRPRRVPTRRRTTAVAHVPCRIPTVWHWRAQRQAVGSGGGCRLPEACTAGLEQHAPARTRRFVAARRMLRCTALYAVCGFRTRLLILVRGDRRLLVPLEPRCIPVCPQIRLLSRGCLRHGKQPPALPRQCGCSPVQGSAQAARPGAVAAVGAAQRGASRRTSYETATTSA